MRRALFFLVPCAVAALFPACAPDLVGPGGDCFQAIDCQPGLVCVPQSGGKRICSNDLTGIATTPPEAGSGDAAPGDAAADASTDGPVQDVSQPDTGTPDSGGSQDAAAD